MKLNFRRTYGECPRSGKLVPIDEMVEDGYIEGLLVASDWFEPKHPQEDNPIFDDEEHSTPAGEISVPAGNGETAPPLGFDAQGNLTFEEEFIVWP